MLKINNYIKNKLFGINTKYLFIFLILILSIPTFWKILPDGIHSMQDFHLFRLHEFNSCIERLEIPCRWSPNSGLGYGEPLFNFYGSGVYWLGEVFYMVTGSYINSIKILFTLSFVGSAISMFFLSKELWKNNLAALLSSVLFIYAPYRAVDVWVRGALPEAFSFVLLPLIVLSIEKKNLFYFSVLSFLLIVTHNLSFVMFLPFLIIWIAYRKWWKGLFGFVISGLLASFYVLPVIFESKYVNLDSTTVGYFDFRAHFITLKQIFFDTTWGYGGSTWGPIDNLNLSVGLLQWVIPLVTIVILFIKYKGSFSKNYKPFYLLLVISAMYLLFTHNKTAFIWEIVPFMKYIQFPWRFLGISVFVLALSSGALLNVIKNKSLGIIFFLIVTVLGMVMNAKYFRPDIWYDVDDSYFLSGSEWDRQRTASIGDYWPQFGHPIPEMPSDGKFINYFPGWESPSPMQDGLILAEGSKFKNTPVRTLGNILTVISFVGLLIWKRKII